MQIKERGFTEKFLFALEKGNLKAPKQLLKHDYHDDVFFKNILWSFT